MHSNGKDKVQTTNVYTPYTVTKVIVGKKILKVRVRIPPVTLMNLKNYIEKIKQTKALFDNLPKKHTKFDDIPRRCYGYSVFSTGDLIIIECCLSKQLKKDTNRPVLPEILGHDW